MRRLNLVATLALAVTLAACDSDHSVTVNPPAPEVTVMTRNLYLGASLDPVIGAPSAQLIPIRVADVWAQVQATNFPERAKSLAAEIAAVQPELIGLQEVSIWRTQSPGDAHLPASTPASEVAFDFLAILMNELAARGQNYRVVSTVDNFDAELFMFTGTPGASPTRDIRLTDRDVILAKSTVETSNARSAQYTARFTINIGGAGGPAVVIPRGWTSVEAMFEGVSFRFFNTHLEIGSAPFGPTQVAQGAEIPAILATSALPVIAVGDFNSPADGSGTTTYTSLRAMLTDTWTEVNGTAPGLTGGLSNDLLGPVSMFNSRIDLVLYNGPFTPLGISLVGNLETSRTPSGLMPSDHAGVVAKIRLGS